MRTVFTVENLRRQSLYVWMDCSPIANHTWLMISFLRVLHDDFASLVNLAEASDLVGNMCDESHLQFLLWCRRVLDGQLPVEDLESERMLREIRDATLVIVKSLDVHMLMPMALGAKAKGILQILAAFHHSTWHEVPSLVALKLLCDRVMGVCSYMGTELSSTSAEEADKASWLHPAIAQGEELQQDARSDGEWSDDERPNPGERAHAFKQAVPSC